MRIAFLAATAAMTLLAGCVMPVATSPVPGAVTTTPGVGYPGTTTLNPASRAIAQNIINAEMTKRLPGVNTQPYTNCVVSNATMAELAELASGAAAPADLVAGIVKRNVTTQCIAKAAATGATA